MGPEAQQAYRSVVVGSCQDLAVWADDGRPDMPAWPLRAARRRWVRASHSRTIGASLGALCSHIGQNSVSSALTGKAHRVAGGAGFAEIRFERCTGASTVAR